MKGFGILNDIDKWVKFTAVTEAKELVPMKDLTDEQDTEMEKVVVPMLDDDEYKASGSAGNIPNESLDKEKKAQLGAAESDKEPQMDGLGIGGGISGSLGKAMSRTEAFEGDEVTDENPMDDARDRTTDTVIERVEDVFNDMFGKSYQDKAKEKDYDFDATKPMVTTKEPAKFKVKKGW
jgi:hypothetical protein